MPRHVPAPVWFRMRFCTLLGILYAIVHITAVWYPQFSYQVRVVMLSYVFFLVEIYNEVIVGGHTPQAKKRVGHERARTAVLQPITLVSRFFRKISSALLLVPSMTVYTTPPCGPIFHSSTTAVLHTEEGTPLQHQSKCFRKIPEEVVPTTPLPAPTLFVLLKRCRALDIGQWARCDTRSRLRRCTRWCSSENKRDGCGINIVRHQVSPVELTQLSLLFVSMACSGGLAIQH